MQGLPNTGRQSNTGKGCQSSHWQRLPVGRQDTCTGLCDSRSTRKTGDKRQQWLCYKLKSLWIHRINMIMRAMCDQSKLNYLSRGLLTPRGFLILHSKTGSYSQFPCSIKVMFSQTNGQSAVPREQQLQSHRPEHPPSRSGPECICRKGLLLTDNFQKQQVFPRGL